MKIFTYFLAGLLFGQLSIAGQIVVKNFSWKDGNLTSESEALRRGTVSIANAYNAFLVSNSQSVSSSQSLKYMCSKVELHYGTLLYGLQSKGFDGPINFLTNNSNYSKSQYHASLSANVVCTERSLLHKTYLSFAVNCEQNPSQECFEKLKDPEFLKILNAIDNPNEQSSENNVRAD